jgi:hypothetical protein
MTSHVYEPGKWPNRSGNHRIKALGGCIVLCTCLDSGNVAEPEHCRGVLDEHYLLIIAVDELKLSIRLADRERQARKSCAGANIENALTVQKWSGNQAVEQMARDHLIRIPNGRQIDLFVPPPELIEQGRE